MPLIQRPLSIVWLRWIPVSAVLLLWPPRPQAIPLPRLRPRLPLGILWMRLKMGLRKRLMPALSLCLTTVWWRFQDFPSINLSVQSVLWPHRWRPQERWWVSVTILKGRWWRPSVLWSSMWTASCPMIFPIFMRMSCWKNWGEWTIPVSGRLPRQYAGAFPMR